jgi:hypothetical protein
LHCRRRGHVARSLLAVAAAIGGAVGCGGESRWPPKRAGDPGTRTASASDRLQEAAGAVRKGESDAIDVDHGPLGDDDFAVLVGLANLKSLRLPEASVTDAALEHLERSAALEVLVLGATQLTDAGLARLARHKGLRALNMECPLVTDAGLAHLTELRELQLVRLQGAQIRGAGLEHLKQLERLRHLLLDDTQLDDAGLAHLETFAALESLYVERTRVSETGLARLREHLPHLHIHWSPGD